MRPAQLACAAIEHDAAHVSLGCVAMCGMCRICWVYVCEEWDTYERAQWRREGEALKGRRRRLALTMAGRRNAVFGFVRGGGRNDGCGNPSFCVV